MTEQNPIFNLSVQTLPFCLDLLPPAACLVGGAVRDALLNCQRDYLDLDFVLPQSAIETARKIANHYHAGFVVLDATRNIARVVFKQGTVDFAKQEGESLEKDLQRRDFTINAIAYNFHQQKLLDPLEGLKDLQTKTLRMISRKNLQDDPLRLLRAYRQAAQLNFTIEPKTRETIRDLASLINNVAAERVQAELNYLLLNQQGSYWLTEIGKDGLLKYWFSTINEDTYERLGKIDKTIEFLENCLEKKQFKQLLNLESQANIYSSSIIQRSKLASLVSHVPEKAEAELLNLKYSRNEIKTVLKVVNNLPWLKKNQGKIALRQLYFFFLEVGDSFPVLAIFATAFNLNIDNILSLINRYLNPQDQVAHPCPLVTGHDLIKHLKMKPSPQLGKLLTEISIARIEGKISTVEEALEYAKIYQDFQEKREK
ncbi:CCA tRNA nucleotidyltransferase [Crocosphaera sp. XPORK-15E]|uniref:CCA tRNA nucleotidyltransferase n=1 Tax=Crocosphaera sp. XPORK-15E TaxID=3110247 RepID=UPI002B2171C1|nr:CCA tRNA nucleotidyltransferase [Crocosphaera sp. XPORK-15E]MEA5535651.1 CCA tRNA nucleotidyltransferase [Crocosphaera sp. XPORK-15E]